MTGDRPALRETVVFLTAVIYWSGVLINAYRVRKRTGKSPNLRPKTFREKLLWASWLIIISGWAGQPFLVQRFPEIILLSFINETLHRYGIPSGILLILSGYAGTLWCYHALGNSWRIGIDIKEKTVMVRQGPYRYVRHPIYLFQMIILAGTAALLPTLFSLLLLLVHFISVLIKASDEEAYLINVHGAEYREYYSKTGRFLPKMKRLS
ncbi:MAG: isoprenylcysteine carboxylmethyltransferase family protein [Nitrospiraceae bacterium]|nr:MAG: isoprenylcysteine carboxylmethyltransferase family protein [Nitrospiraceae bacterium]